MTSNKILPHDVTLIERLDKAADYVAADMTDDQGFFSTLIAARDRLGALAPYAAVVDAARVLVKDIRDRHPDQPLTCPHLIELDQALQYDPTPSNAAAEETLIEVLKEVRDALQWMIENDETYQGDEPVDKLGGQTWNQFNAYWIEGLQRARAAKDRADKILQRDAGETAGEAQ